MTTEPMTAEQAQTFEHGISIANATAVAQAMVEKGCGCVPYVDVFSYRRWQAQGYQVQKGEHGIKVTTWIHYTDKEGKDQVRPKNVTLFCRHQVKPIEGGTND